MPRAPIWKSIAETLTAEIADGHWPVGRKLPTEAEFSARFGVNRHTVRRALSALSEAGLVQARRGSGVFVAAAATEYPIGSRVRFHRNLEAAGKLPEKRVLSTATRPADADEAAALGLKPGEEVHVYDGLSLADGQPIAVFRSSFPAKRFPGLCEQLVADRSVTASLRRHGVADYTRASTRLTAVAASAAEAGHLGLRVGAPVLRSVGVNVDPDGRPVEYGITSFAGERVTLTVETP